jgi:uncharacterized protein
MLFFITAISIGFLGSFHCIGMCGPIALALPINQSSLIHKISGVIIYNSGRVFTYSLLGILFGLIGTGFAVFGLQKILSIFLGITILLSVIIPKKYISRFRLTGKFSGLFFNLKSRLGNLFLKRTFLSLFTIGLLNGLLPCGLVYIALTGAVASGTVLKGTAFMMAFGLGTVPVMLSLSWFKNIITIKFRSGINKAMPYLISTMAILMIFRGMNLGIPYLSPGFEAKTKSITCCEKTTLNNKSIIKSEENCCHKKN